MVRWAWRLSMPSKPGALCAVEAGLHMHQRAQAKRASMLDVAPPEEGGGKRSPGEGAVKRSPGEAGSKRPSGEGATRNSPGEGASQRVPREGGARKPRRGPPYVPCQDAEGRCREAHSRLCARRAPVACRHSCGRQRALGAASGAHRGERPRRGPPGRRRIVLAPVLGPDFAGHHHAVADQGDRRERRQPVSDRGRRHGAGARRARPRRHPHPRHQGSRPRRGAGRRVPRRPRSGSPARACSAVRRAPNASISSAPSSAVRVEADGRVSVSTAAAGRPLATTASLASVAPSTPAPPAPPLSRGGDKHSLQDNIASFLGWLDSLGALGLDGGDLTEIGLKSGNLVVDDVRSGHQSKFENIRLSLTRPHSGEPSSPSAPRTPPAPGWSRRP